MNRAAAARSTFLPPLPITSGRLQLRALTPADAQLYSDLYTDPQTMRHIGPPLTRSQAARSFRTALRSRDPPFAGPLFLTIIERASQNSLGLCAIQPITRAHAETGVIISAAARGRGFATESLHAVISWALASSVVDCLWVRICAGHRAAECLVRAVGLRPAAPAMHTAAQLSPPCPAAAPAAEVIWYADRNI